MSETEERCPTCKKLISDCSCVHIVSEKKSEGEGEETTESLKEKLEERDSQLALISLAEFEKSRKALLDSVTDPRKKAYVEKYIGDDPERMETIKAWTSLISTGVEQSGGKIKYDDGTEPKPPKGANIPAAQNENSTAKERVKERIDILFAIIQDPSKSRAEVDAANAQITEMYKSAKSGWEASGQKNPTLLPTMTCVKCGQTMHGNKCYSCGWEIPKIQQDSPFKK